MTGMGAAAAADAGKHKMQVEKIPLLAHGDTKSLYREVFSEDTPEFVEYYYQNCAAENEIYAVKDQGRICAMLHTNPYQMRLGPWQGECCYIVAVATKEEYRHRGLMTQLLQAVMEELYQKRHPFVFLMPAAEAIYHPFDFRFLYRQRQAVLETKNLGRLKKGLKIRKAREEDTERLSAFAQKALEPYRTAAVHTKAYFSRLLKEQASQGGEVMVIEKEEAVCGYFFTSREAGEQVREAMIAPEYGEWLFPAVGEWAEREAVQVFSWPDWADAPGLRSKKEAPMMMGRVIHLEALVSCLRAREPLSLVIQVQDRWLRQNSGVWRMELSPSDGKLTRLEGEEKPAWSVDAGDFTRWAFGCAAPGELGVSAEAEKTLGRAVTLAPVMLNEIV